MNKSFETQLVELSTNLVTRQKIEFSECGLDEIAAKKIVAVLANNPNIKHLALERCQLTDAALQVLATELTTNQTLTWLNLHYCTFTSNGYGTKLFIQAIEQNQTLKDLILKGIHFSEDDMLTLLPAIDKNRNLNFVSLTLLPLNNFIPKLAKFLERNKTLENLYINVGDIIVSLTQDEINLIINALANNHSLQYLKFAKNNTFEDIEIDMSVIEEVLRVNFSIEYPIIDKSAYSVLVRQREAFNRSLRFTSYHAAWLSLQQQLTDFRSPQIQKDIQLLIDTAEKYLEQKDSIIRSLDNCYVRSDDEKRKRNSINAIIAQRESELELVLLMVQIISLFKAIMLEAAPERIAFVTAELYGKLPILRQILPSPQAELFLLAIYIKSSELVQQQSFFMATLLHHVSGAPPVQGIRAVIFKDNLLDWLELIYDSMKLNHLEDKYLTSVAEYIESVKKFQHDDANRKFNPDQKTIEILRLDAKLEDILQNKTLCLLIAKNAILPTKRLALVLNSLVRTLTQQEPDKFVVQSALKLIAELPEPDVAPISQQPIIWSSTASAPTHFKVVKEEPVAHALNELWTALKAEVKKATMAANPKLNDE